METEILSLATIITLCTLSFFTAIISGIFGMIGGVILVVVGTFFVPFDVFLPIHACVQLAANGARVLMAWSDLDKPVLARFSVGTVIGNLVGTSIVVAISRPLMVIIAYSFILTSTWIKMLSFNFRGGLVALGGLQGFISGLVGATGPIGMPTLIHRYGGMGDYNRIVITNSGMNLVSHIARAGAFLLWGYAYGAVWEIIVGMVITTIGGTFVGTKIRNKITNKDRMIWILKIVLSMVVIIGLIRVVYTSYI